MHPDARPPADGSSPVRRESRTTPAPAPRTDKRSWRSALVVEQREAQAFAGLEQTVGPISTFLARGSQPDFIDNHLVQSAQPPVVLGKPLRRFELAEGQLVLTLGDGMAALVKPVPDLGFEVDPGELRA